MQLDIIQRNKLRLMCRFVNSLFNIIIDFMYPHGCRYFRHKQVMEYTSCFLLLSLLRLQAMTQLSSYKTSDGIHLVFPFTLIVEVTSDDSVVFL